MDAAVLRYCKSVRQRITEKFTMRLCVLREFGLYTPNYGNKYGKHRSHADMRVGDRRFCNDYSGGMRTLALFAVLES